LRAPEKLYILMGMTRSPQHQEVLAHWHYEPELWRDFVQYESGIYRKSVRSARYFIIGTIIGTVALITLFSVIPLLVTKKFDSSIWGPTFGIIVIAAICLAIGTILLLIRREKITKLKAKNGEVRLTLNELNINDIVFSWNYGESSGWRFIDAERKTVSVAPLKSIQVLELKFVTFIPSKNTPQRETGEWRVPVQTGKESEADRVIERLRAQRLVSEPK
jgi:hypothetical protein